MTVSRISLNGRLLRAVLVSAVSGLLMAGCGGAGSGGTNSASLYVLAESGSSRSLDGTWRTACFLNGYSDEMWELTFSGSQVTQTTNVYTSTNNTCGGTPTVTQASGTISTDIDFKTYGWSDGSVIVATPPTSQAGGTLSLTPTVTGIMASGTPMGFYYIDDTSTTWCLYAASSYPRDQDSNNYPDYAFADDTPWCKI